MHSHRVNIISSSTTSGMICHHRLLCTQENNKQEGKVFIYCLTGIKIQETTDLIVEDLGSHALFFGEGNGNPLGTLAWKIPWTEEPGRLKSMGSLRVGHD